MKFKKFILCLVLLLAIGLTGCISTPKRKISTLTQVEFNNVVGLCGWCTDNINELQSASGIIREYHNYTWITDKYVDKTGGLCRFKNSWMDWDQYYKNLRDKNIDILVCIQGTSPADRTGIKNTNDREKKPANTGESTTDAFSYSEHASTMFQFAARYGSKTVSEDKLKLESGQTAKSGLNYIKYYEDWNEQDKQWMGAECKFSGAEYCAMASADYDGHEGKIGNTYGIKNADPDAKLVMGGLAGGRYTVEYLDEMLAWAKENRDDGRLPIDVINFHMYAYTSSPEQYGYVENFKKIVDWRNTNAPYLEIFMTEFGWDTNANSEFTSKDAATQRDWLMRTFLIGNAHGIDRMTMYSSYDVSPNSSTKYQTCGLSQDQKGTKKKTSWYGVATLKNVLEGFIMDSIITENENVYVYKLVNKKTGENCYVVWSPTRDGSSLENYSLNIGKGQNATLTTFEDKSTTGKTNQLDIQNQCVNIDVNETPCFVKVK